MSSQQWIRWLGVLSRHVWALGGPEWVRQESLVADPWEAGEGALRPFAAAAGPGALLPSPRRVRQGLAS